MAKEDAMSRPRSIPDPLVSEREAARLERMADRFLRKHGLAKDGRELGTAPIRDAIHKAVRCPIGSGKRQWRRFRRDQPPRLHSELI